MVANNKSDSYDPKNAHVHSYPAWVTELIRRKLDVTIDRFKRTGRLQRSNEPDVEQSQPEWPGRDTMV